jgi:hypothetical protein
MESRRAVTDLAKVDFIEDDLVGVADAPEPGDEGKDGGNDKADAVLEVRLLLGLGLGDDGGGLGLGLDLELLLRGRRRHSPLGAIVALAHAALRGGSRGRHIGRRRRRRKEEFRAVRGERAQVSTRL